MGETLTIEYDAIGDFLFVDVCQPYAEQDSDGIGDDIVARFNLETMEIETIEILFFEARQRKGSEIRIPVNASLFPSDRTYEEVFTQPVSHDTTLTVRYDSDSDVLTIFRCPSYTGQITKEIDDFVIARMNPATMAIEYVEILLFRRRLERDGKMVLPINATFRLVKSAVAAD